MSFPKRRWEGKCVPPPLEGLSLWGHQWFGWWGRGPEQYNRRAAVSYNGQEGSLTMGRTYAITPPSSLEVPTWVVTSSHMVSLHTDSSHIGLFPHLQFWSCMSFAILIEPFSFLDGSILKKYFRWNCKRWLIWGRDGKMFDALLSCVTQQSKKYWKSVHNRCARLIYTLW